MCGICGLSYDDRKTVKEMCKAIAHRGPDAEGIYNDKGITLGHRRLSIIDTKSRSNQPFVYSHKNKEVVIVFNGEIYNFPILKSDLEKKGYRFRTTSDTEVVCAAYIEYGSNIVNLFDGMFAFAIYDGNNIFFARDFAGEKPFYYFYDGKNFGFASELKALLKVKKNLTIDQQAIDYYLSFNFVPAPYSIYNEIRKLPAAHYGFFDTRKKSLEIRSYRYFPAYAPKKNIEKDVEKALERSVKSRLISDVPVGLILSAGLDSTTVAYFASKEIEHITAYSVEFEVNDESALAEKLAGELGINFIRVPFDKKDFYDYHDVVMKEHDEPFGDHSSFPTTKVSKFARMDMTVALSGDGGDEVFGGYDVYQKAYLLEKLKRVHNPLFKLGLKAISPASRGIRELLEVIDQPLENFKSFSQELYRYMTPEARNLSREKIRELMKTYP
ncbi:MAG: asparagine synthase (glutamine-hydrolyzing), partial [Candidatus Micrarchaeia archaeon]